MSSQNRSLVQGVILFLFGFVILLSGLMLLLSMTMVGTPLAIFTTIDLSILYVLVFGPLILGSSVEELTAGRIVSLGIAWRGVMLYALVTAIVLYAAYTVPNPPLPLLAIVQLVGLFCFALYSYFGQVTSQHIAKVGKDQAGARASIDGLRDASAQLAAQVRGMGMGDDFESKEIVGMVNRIAEELRYVSPVQSVEAEELEARIASCLSALSARIATGDLALLTSAETRDVARAALSLIAQRKTLRNA